MATGTTQTITNGLIFYVDAANVKSYPGSGTTWTDLSSTAITGSLTNGPTFNSANGGNIRFDGTNDYVFVKDGFTNTIRGRSQWAASIWFKGDNLTSIPVLLGPDAGQLNYFDLFLEVGQNQAYMAVGGGSGANYISATGTDITLQSGSIYNATWVYNNKTGSFYLNGINITMTKTGTGLGDTPTSNADFRIGAFKEGSYYLSGSIYNVSIFNRALSSDEVLQNYESTRERFNLRGIAIDPDASLFLRTAGITDTTQQSAIDTLVLEMKNAGLWSKMKAIYPFVGGTASTHKWNLKDPRDVDAAFRLTFSGGWTHSSTGAKPNGTTGYANTYWNTTNNGSTTGHMSFYSRTNNVENSVDMGSQIQSPDSYTYLLQFNSSLFVRDTRWCETAAGNTRESNITNTSGYIVTSRRGAADASAYRNGTKTVSNLTNVSPNTSTVNIVIGARNFNGSIDFYSSRECAFASIGDSFTDTELSNLYTIVQKYQTTLGRQV